MEGTLRIPKERTASSMDLFDYLERQIASFDEEPFNAVDSAVLTQFCMVRNTEAAPAFRPAQPEGALGSTALDALADRWHALTTPAARFADFAEGGLANTTFTGLDPINIRHALFRLIWSPRFSGLQIRDYADVLDEERRAQFSATVFVWRDAWAYVGFRGTDTTITGWRENFDMAAEPPVPAQRLAQAYLETVARHLPRRLYVGGHSKGGNLATYAALRCQPAVQERILGVFDHDGPGFKPGFVGAEEYAALAGRIHRTVPEESLVGMLMESGAPTLVVRSSERSVAQHSVFTWEVAEGLDDFAYADGLSTTAILAHDIMNEWLASMAEDEVPRVVEALFATIEASGVDNASEIFSGDSEALAAVAETARKMDRETSAVLVPALRKLTSVAAARTAREVGRSAPVQTVLDASRTLWERVAHGA